MSELNPSHPSNSKKNDPEEARKRVDTVVKTVAQRDVERAGPSTTEIIGDLERQLRAEASSSLADSDLSVAVVSSGETMDELSASLEQAVKSSKRNSSKPRLAMTKASVTFQLKAPPKRRTKRVSRSKPRNPIRAAPASDSRITELSTSVDRISTQIAEVTAAVAALTRQFQDLWTVVNRTSNRAMPPLERLERKKH